MAVIKEVLIGVSEHMKDLIKKIKKMIASGEDPELVRKLQDVVDSSEEMVVKEEPSQPAPIALPSEIPIPNEVFDEMRQIAAEKTKLEATLGQYFTQFQKQMQEISDKIEEKATMYLDAQKIVVETYSPEGHADEYKLTDLGLGSDGKQKIVLRREITEE